MSNRRVSEIAERPRAHLRVIRGRPLVDQLAIELVRQIEALRAEIERDPSSITRITLTVDVANGLAGRGYGAIQRAHSTALTGTG